MELGSVAGSIINGFILLALAIVVMAPAYWLMKKMGYLDRPDEITIPDDFEDLFPPPPAEISNESEIDDSKLSVAQAYLSSGESFDTVCGLLDPAYRRWSADRKAAYRDNVSTRLAALRPVEREGGEPNTA